MLLAAVLALLAGPALPQSASAPTTTAQRVFGEHLPNVPGKSLTAVVVDFPPGVVSRPHHHAGAVFVYVLSGAVRSQLAGGEARVYRAGETFFEPPGAHHVHSASASATEPARILAVFVADDGATLTTYDQ
jgi:quercetin dioxygenase-like cupin family protein